MVEFPIPESAAAPESQTSKKGQFGVALEPEVVRISGFALPVGQVPGVGRSGSTRAIYPFINVFFYGKFSKILTLLSSAGILRIEPCEL